MELFILDDVLHVRGAYPEDVPDRLVIAARRAGAFLEGEPRAHVVAWRDEQVAKDVRARMQSENGKDPVPQPHTPPRIKFADFCRENPHWRRMIADHALNDRHKKVTRAILLGQSYAKAGRLIGVSGSRAVGIVFFTINRINRAISRAGRRKQELRRAQMTRARQKRNAARLDEIRSFAEEFNDWRDRIRMTATSRERGAAVIALIEGRESSDAVVAKATNWAGLVRSANHNIRRARALPLWRSTQSPPASDTVSDSK